MGIMARRFLTVLSGGSVALVPFSDSFTRGDGDLGNEWNYTAGLWTISSGAALGTPGLGANLVANGTFDADTDWTKEAGWTIGGGVANIANGAANVQMYQTVLTASKWYRCDWTITAYAAGSPRALFGGQYDNSYPSSTGTFVSSHYAAGSTRAGFFAGWNSSADIDNVTFKLITYADMFCTRDMLQSNIDISVDVTLTKNNCAGIVICLDDKDNPANYIVGYHDGTWAHLKKCVGGTITSLIGTAATYGAGRTLRVVKSGTTVQLYYNGVQIGANQTVSDAGIISNTRHGMLSTYSGNTLDNFSAANPT